MPLPTGDVIGILADNLRLRKSVLPLPTRVATKWTEGLDLPRGGETVLYTGMMYQLIPYIEGLVKAETKVGRLVAGRADRPGPQGEPARQHLGLHGAALGGRARRVQPRADRRRSPAAQGRRRVRRPL